MNGNTDLQQQTASGLSWRFITVIGQFALQFIVSIVLARLLPPEDFGLVALALVFINFGRIINDLGFAQSMIQRHELSKRHVRVGFTISVLLGAFVTLCVYGIAPLAALFFRDPRVIPLLRFIGLSFLFTGLGITSEALMKRRLDFKSLMVVELASYGVGYGLVSIWLALIGFGEWSLAWGVLAQSVTNGLLAYLLVQHSLRPLIAKREFKELAGFGVGISLNQIVNYFARKGDYFIVGRFLGNGPLGLYSRAYQLMVLPLTYFGQVLSSVLFPAVSRIQKNDEKVRVVYRQAIRSTSIVVLPAMAMMVILAPELVVGLYGEKWRGTIIPLQILAAFGLFRTTYNVAGSFIKARGRVYRLFTMQLIYSVAVVGGTWWAATRWNINGVALAVGLAILLMYVLVITTTNLITETSSREFISLHLPSVLLTIPVVVFCLLSRRLFLNFGVHTLVVLGGVASLTLVGVLGWLHVGPLRMVQPVMRAIDEILEQGVFSARIAQFLRSVLPVHRVAESS